MSTFVDVPEIKLIRTDTTLDLSQKAEKVCFVWVSGPFKYPADSTATLRGGLTDLAALPPTRSKQTNGTHAFHKINYL